VGVVRTSVPVRLICVLGTVAAVLYPALAAPARTFTVPRMLFASTTVDRAHGRVALDRPLTHVAFSWTGSEGGRIRYRTVDAEGVTTRWRRAPETHDLAENDRHYTGVSAIYGARAVQWRRSVPRGGWMGPVTIDVMDALSGPRREVTVPALAHGLASEPRIITRAEWGADESLQRSSGGCRRTFFPVQQMFAHHTAGSNRDGHPRATMRSIYWFHTARRGWCDIAYNFVISRDGSIFEGRWARKYLPWELHDAESPSGQLVRGAHTLDHNPGAVGVSLMGSFGSVRPTRNARRALVRVLAWEADRHGLNPEGRHVYVNGETGARRRLRVIAGHRDARATSCPGAVLYRMLPGIRRSVARRIGDGKINANVTMSKSISPVSYGDPATVTATLSAGGSTLSGAPLRLYQRAHGKAWTLLSETTTDAFGRVSVEVTPSVTTRFAAAYPGARRIWSAQSKTMRLPVAPILGLTAEGGTGDESTRSYPAETTSITLTGSVSPAHRGRTVSLFIERLDELGNVIISRTASVPVSADGATYSYALATTAGRRHRITATLAAHGDHSAARSPELNVIVAPVP
jgi:hypothetical protein